MLLLFLLFLHFGMLGSFVVPVKEESSIPCCWSILVVSTVVCTISMGSSSSGFSAHCLMLSILSSSGSSPSLESSWAGGVSGFVTLITITSSSVMVEVLLVIFFVVTSSFMSSSLMSSSSSSSSSSPVSFSKMAYLFNLAEHHLKVGGGGGLIIIILSKIHPNVDIEILLSIFNFPIGQVWVLVHRHSCQEPSFLGVRASNIV